ncbi:helix-turn-helix domain-containing protein [Vogesella mureinivorans]|uniref:helix-turn-helix domain-containing protein n=1 Tax=Vogesella mureinivorans TaxID=657276 RepID=UPI0011C8CB24|nr:helix-turn-helix transcriptional regulator [Vogesella mureinivorans]
MKEILIRQILATNLRNWMNSAEGELGTQLGLSSKAGIAQSTIGRMLSCQNSANIDVVEQIARAFGRSASELLENPTSGHIQYDRTGYDGLSTEDRSSIERYIAFVISESKTCKQRVD